LSSAKREFSRLEEYNQAADDTHQKEQSLPAEGEWSPRWLIDSSMPSHQDILPRENADDDEPDRHD
jgi:hypothetical protein